MNTSRRTRGAVARATVVGTLVASGAWTLTAAPVEAAGATAQRSGATLTVTGSRRSEKIVVSRSAAGTILVHVNGLRLSVSGGTPTVANTNLIEVSGGDGKDLISLDETAGALPAAELRGGRGKDTLIGGSGADLLVGDEDEDVLDGRGGADVLNGGDDRDRLIGGDGDDQLFGGPGDDTLIWNPGDDTDLFEGGDGFDVVRVHGGNGSEQFAATANGARVRFDRIDPGPFSLDIGSAERLELFANAGDDTFVATGNLAALISITVDGGAGDDALHGSNGHDTLRGGPGNDVVDGQQGNDVAWLGTGNDVYQWDPGDGNDRIEGQGGSDRLDFRGSGAIEAITLTANGRRAMLTRDLGSITLDLDDIETVDVALLGGSDALSVHDMSGTDVTHVIADQAGILGGDTGDGSTDSVSVHGGPGADTLEVAANGAAVRVTRGEFTLDALATEAAHDSIRLFGAEGNDVLTASGNLAALVSVLIDGGDGNDVITGGNGHDTLIGGNGNDVITGKQGNDAVFMNAGNDTARWEPGDGNDVVEGGPGSDSVIVTGSSASEGFSISPNGFRTTVFRDVGNVTLDVDDVETIEVRALGGADTVTVGDLTGPYVTLVRADLAGTPGGTSGDSTADQVIVNGTGNADSIDVTGAAGTATVSGLGAQVVVMRAQPADDRLIVNGAGGADVVNASALPANSIRLTLNGGLGDDRLLGGAGPDIVNGGDGADTIRMGSGNDTMVWNPGDDNDVVDGQGGSDTLMFVAANTNEMFDISANGSRVTFFRDVANVVLDLGGIELVDVHALGGTDTITVNNLSGTGVTDVTAILAAALNGVSTDGVLDQVVVRGTPGDDAFVVSGSTGFVDVGGLAYDVHVTFADPSTDVLTVQGLAGNDIIDTSGLAAVSIQFVWQP